MMAVIAMSYTTISHAQVKGVYQGKLDVSTPDAQIPTIDQDIYVIQAAENEITLKIKDFSIEGMTIGDIVVNEIELQTAGGGYSFAKDDIISAGIFTSLEIELQGSISTEGELNLSLEISNLGITVDFSDGVRRDFYTEVMAGVYEGDLYISTPDAELPAIDQEIEIVSTEDREISLNISDFSLEGMTIGDVVVTEVEVVELTNGTYTFEKQDIISAGVFTSLEIDLEGNVDAEGKLNLTLEITNLGISVKFVDGVTNSIYINTNQSEFSVYPTTTYDVLNVTGTKESSKYAIYNIAGINVKSGNIYDNAINVSDLSKGIYIINAEGRSIKFIKK